MHGRTLLGQAQRMLCARPYCTFDAPAWRSSGDPRYWRPRGSVSVPRSGYIPSPAARLTSSAWRRSTPLSHTSARDGLKTGITHLWQARPGAAHAQDTAVQTRRHAAMPVSRSRHRHRAAWQALTPPPRSCSALSTRVCPPLPTLVCLCALQRCEYAGGQMTCASVAAVGRGKRLCTPEMAAARIMNVRRRVLQLVSHVTI